MDISFKPNHLLLPELNYELRIRNTFTDKPHDDKRKILGRLLVKERQQNFDISKLKVPNFDFAVEKKEIETTLASIETLISDFEGPSTDSCFLRANSRLLHVTNRIQRIPLEEGTQQDAILKFKNESYATSLKLEADLYEHVRDVDPNLTLNNSLSHTQINNAVPIISVPTNSKTVPVYKLGIQFDGNPKNLLSFIEKVEEVSYARNVSKVDLFQSASDLFTSKATFWYRQIKPSVNNWESLVEKLKKDFLVSDFDDELWNQIKSRRQDRNEPVVIFIACMETLFSRLSHYPAEVTKIKYIKHGLQPEYQKRLALSEVDSIDTLSKLCKKLEEADVLSLASTSNTSKFSLESELAYVSDNTLNKNKKKHFFSNYKGKSKFSNNNFNVDRTKNSSSSNVKINTLETKSSNSPSNPVVCWSCGQLNHTFRNCLSSSRNKFCFKCGTPNVTVKECKKCSGNV